jgi:plastocyanin
VLLAALVLLAGGVAHAAPWTFTVTDGAGQPLALAVVAVHVKGADTVAAPGTVAEMGQHYRQFTPQMIAVQTGTQVSFPNYDKVRHHVYSFSPIKPFELKLYSDQPPKSILFDKPGTAVLGCNIHDQMLGWVHVVSTPLFTITDASGKARFDLPPGSHRVSAWQAQTLEDGPPVEQVVTVDRDPGAVTLRLVHP